MNATDSAIHMISRQRSLRNEAMLRARLVNYSETNVATELKKGWIKQARMCNRWVVIGWKRIRARQIDMFTSN